MAGYIYLIKEVNEDPYADFWNYKIGSTANDPKKRLAQLQTGCPNELEISEKYYFWHKDFRENEREMHKLLHSYRVNGEWFRIGCPESVMALFKLYGKYNNDRVLAVTKVGPITYGMQRTGERILRDLEKSGVAHG